MPAYVCVWKHLKNELGRAQSVQTIITTDVHIVRVCVRVRVRVCGHNDDADDCRWAPAFPEHSARTIKPYL